MRTAVLLLGSIASSLAIATNSEWGVMHAGMMADGMDMMQGLGGGAGLVGPNQMGSMGINNGATTGGHAGMGQMGNVLVMGGGPGGANTQIGRSMGMDSITTQAVQRAHAGTQGKDYDEMLAANKFITGVASQTQSPQFLGMHQGMGNMGMAGILSGASAGGQDGVKNMLKEMDQARLDQTVNTVIASSVHTQKLRSLQENACRTKCSMLSSFPRLTCMDNCKKDDEAREAAAKALSEANPGLIQACRQRGMMQSGAGGLDGVVSQEFIKQCVEQDAMRTRNCHAQCTTSGAMNGMAWGTQTGMDIQQWCTNQCKVEQQQRIRDTLASTSHYSNGQAAPAMPTAAQIGGEGVVGQMSRLNIQFGGGQAATAMGLTASGLTGQTQRFVVGGALIQEKNERGGSSLIQASSTTVKSSSSPKDAFIMAAEDMVTPDYRHPDLELDDDLTSVSPKMNRLKAKI